MRWMSEIELVGPGGKKIRSTSRDAGAGDPRSRNWSWDVGAEELDVAIDERVGCRRSGVTCYCHDMSTPTRKTFTLRWPDIGATVLACGAVIWFVAWAIMS